MLLVFRRGWTSSTASIITRFPLAFAGGGVSGSEQVENHLHPPPVAWNGRGEDPATVDCSFAFKSLLI